MSRDFLASRVRSNALIGNNNGQEPSLLLYPSSQASNNQGTRNWSQIYGGLNERAKVQIGHNLCSQAR